MSDVTTMVKSSRDYVTTETILRYWVKSNFLPDIAHNELSSQYSKTQSTVSYADVEKVVKVLDTISI